MNTLNTVVPFVVRPMKTCDQHVARVRIHAFTHSRGSVRICSAGLPQGRRGPARAAGICPAAAAMSCSIPHGTPSIPLRSLAAQLDPARDPALSLAIRWDAAVGSRISCGTQWDRSGRTGGSARVSIGTPRARAAKHFMSRVLQLARIRCGQHPPACPGALQVPRCALVVVRRAPPNRPRRVRGPS